MAQATDSNITNLERDNRHADYSLLHTAATWQLARAQARLAFAEHDLKTLFYTRKAEIETPAQAVDRMREAQEALALFEPKTTLGARVMLEAAVDMMSTAQADPESCFAEGPALAITISVARSMRGRDIALEA